MLANEIELCAKADRVTKLKSSSGKDLFDADDIALLGFLKPISLISAGPKIIQEFRKYHDPHAGDFVKDIIALLDEGQTVIIDLGNAAPEVTNYFSVYLSKAIFRNQFDKFSNNKLGGHYLQLFFEEAHNLFPTKEEDEVDIYRRIAKEGAKYHIGMVYSTQSPTTISPDLLAQTENFFIAHLASQDDVNRLAKLNVAYESLKDDILQAKTVGYIRMLTRSHRFVVSMQALRFTPPQKVN
jgi:DNA helicase HerA-like ATPase